MQTADYLIIGAGVVGLTLARELVSRGAENIIILEKEPAIALHASGRNSGVMHAGIYYPPETLKAQFCLKGSRLMQQFCAENNLPLMKTGKVIVARTEVELATLKMLYERAKQNGANVNLIDLQQLSELEPYAKSHELALYSHDTAVIDPVLVMKKLEQDLLATGKVKIIFSCCFVSNNFNNSVQTSCGVFNFKKLINAAGSFADKVAHTFGVRKDLVLLPFKGIYKKLKPEYGYLCNGNIYPVPDIRNPFLGVHFTRNVHGDVYVGPTAIPALGRENYGLIKGIDREAFSIAWKELVLFFTNPKFRNVALSEPKKYIPSCFFNDAKKLVKELELDWMKDCPKVGIRPQLVNWQTKELMMDFLVEKQGDTVHVLNAISPAFTSSMAFANYVIDEYVEKI